MLRVLSFWFRRHKMKSSAHLVSLFPDLVLHCTSGFTAIGALADPLAFSVFLLRQLQSDENDSNRVDVVQTVQDVLPLDDS